MRLQFGKKLMMLAVAMVTAGVGMTGQAEAASGVISVTPGTFSIVQASTVVVDIRENSGSNPVNAVSMSISYPSAQVEVESVDATGSAFDVQLQNSGGGGVVNISRSKSGAPLTGDQRVGRIVIKGVGLGYTRVAMTSGSLTSSDTSQDVLATADGSTLATINVTTPHPGGNTGAVGAGSGSSSSGSSPVGSTAQPAQPADPEPTPQPAAPAAQGASTNSASTPSSSLPDTGAVSLLGGGLGLSAIGYGVRARFMSRRSLRAALARR